MKEALSNYMKVGIVQFMAYPKCMSGEGDISSMVAPIVNDSFFDSIEVTWVKDPAERKKVAALLATAHIHVGFGGQPVLLSQQLSLNDLDDEKRAKAVSECVAAVDIAADLGAKAFAVLSGPDPGDAQREKGMEALIDSLKQLAAAARAKSMPLILETFDRAIDKKSIVGPVALAAELAQEMRKDYGDFGLMYDLSHQPLLYEQANRDLPVIAPYLAHIHIGNAAMRDPKDPAYGDKHPRFGYPGGENDVPELVEFLRVLFDIGYLGGRERPVVAFEVAPVGDESSEALVAGAQRTLKAAWAEL